MAKTKRNLWAATISGAALLCALAVGAFSLHLSPGRAAELDHRVGGCVAAVCLRPKRAPALEPSADTGVPTLGAILKRYANRPCARMRKPGSIEQFKKATVENARKSIEEPGIARFEVVQNASDPASFVQTRRGRSPAAS